MGLKIFWTDFSLKELENIYEYHRENAEIRIAKKLVDGLYKETLKLKKQPKIGQVEELLRSRKEEFRYLLYKNYKIIYWINYEANQVEIIDVLDTQRSPVKIERNK